MAHLRSVRSRVVLGVACALVTACDKKEAAPAGAAPGAPPSSAAPTASAPTHVENVEIPELAVAARGPTVVRVAWRAPEGTTVNDEAPFRVRWNRSDGLVAAPADVRATGSTAKDGFQVTVEPTPGTPNATLGGAIDLVVCDAETHSVCVPVRRTLELGFVVVDGGPSEAKVAIPLPHARPR